MHGTLWRAQVSPEQVVAMVGAFTALLAAIASLMIQIRQLHDAVDGRLSELLMERETAARKLGELEGRDFMRRLLYPQGVPPPVEPQPVERPQ